MIPLSPAQQTEQDLEGSLMREEGLSPWRKVLHTLVGQSPREQFTSLAGGGGMGTLKFLDPRALAAGMGAKQLLPRRVWDFLTRSPNEIQVQSAPLPTDTWGRFVAGKNHVLLNPLSGAPDHTVAHELTHAAIEEARRIQGNPTIGRNPSGFQFQPEHRLPMLQRYGPGDYNAEKLPEYLANPNVRVRIKNLKQALGHLEEYWP